MSNQLGVLYVVATPIGNLEDVTARARRVLAEVDLIAAEDTRHSKKLLSHLGIATPMCAYHDHNEVSASVEIVEQLKRGRNVALISDAGTPLVHDPGYRLVKLAHENNIRLVPVPGPSALTAALSVAGLGSGSFVFEGFLPDKAAARRVRLQQQVGERRSMVFYEAPHRIRAFITDCVAVFGTERRACIARELSKYHETIVNDTLGNLADWLEEDENHRKGEFVVVIAGNDSDLQVDQQEAIRILTILLQDVPVKKAAGLAAEITGLKKNALYKLALSLKK